MSGRFLTWAAVFVCGRLSGWSFPFVSGRLCTWAVGGRAHGGNRYAGCRSCHGRVLVVLLPCCHGRRGSCIRCE